MGSKINKDLRIGKPMLFLLDFIMNSIAKVVRMANYNGYNVSK